LEPVRQYARRHLAAHGEDDAVCARHATYYAALAEQAAPLLRGPEQLRWLDRLEAERDNLRAALSWITQHDDVEAGLRLAVALMPYWEAHGSLSEGRSWLSIVLTASRTHGASDAMQMQALMAAGGLAQWQGDLEAAAPLLEDSLSIARRLADRPRETELLGWLSSVYRRQGAFERALDLGETSLRLARELADTRLIAFALLNIGVAWNHRHEPERVGTMLDESLHRYRALGDTRYVAITSTMLGWSMVEAGQYDRADQYLREGLFALRTVGDHGFIVHALRGLARVAHGQGEPRRAATWLGASDALRESLGMQLPPPTQATNRRLLDDLRQQLTAQDVEEAYALGQAMSLDAVLAEIDVSP
jgi:tetratricopeptide (TPR) repeat protein